MSEVVWNGPAFHAGIVAGATIVAVGDARYEPEQLITAIRQNRDGGRPIRLVVNTRGRERTVTIDYRGGLRFPRLERVDTIPDRLGALLRSRVGSPSP